MTKVSITQLPVFLLLVATIIASCSQNLLPNAAVPNTTVPARNEEQAEPVTRSQVDIRAARSFYQVYGEEQSASWYRSPKGFIVSFENDGMKRLVHYTQNGVETSRITSYFEKKLAPELRHIVKSNFYDYAILYVTEIQKNDATAFYVKIQNSTTIKTIKIVDGEWSIAEDLVRR